MSDPITSILDIFFPHKKAPITDPLERELIEPKGSLSERRKFTDYLVPPEPEPVPLHEADEREHVETYEGHDGALEPVPDYPKTRTTHVTVEGAEGFATSKHNVPSLSSNNVQLPYSVAGWNPRRRTIILVNKSLTAIPIAIGGQAVSVANSAALAQNDWIALDTKAAIYAISDSGALPATAVTGILHVYELMEDDSY